MTTYMEKYPRRNGVAAKKPGFWKRLIKGIIPWKGDSAAAVIRKLVFIIALIVFLVTAIPLVSDVFMMFRDQWRSQGISNIYIPDGNSGGASKEILPSFKKLLEINPDTVGYLKIDGTAIDYPVVKGKDNDYYLTHDFYGEKSKSGPVMTTATEWFLRMEIRAIWCFTVIIWLSARSLPASVNTGERFMTAMMRRQCSSTRIILP